MIYIFIKVIVAHMVPAIFLYNILICWLNMSLSKCTYMQHLPLRQIYNDYVLVPSHGLCPHSISLHLGRSDERTKLLETCASWWVFYIICYFVDHIIWVFTLPNCECLSALALWQIFNDMAKLQHMVMSPDGTNRYVQVDVLMLLLLVFSILIPL